MRLDSANRNFLALVGIALMTGAFAICGAGWNVLLPLLWGHLEHEGIGALQHVWLAPALLFVAVAARGLALALRSLARQLVLSYRLARKVQDLSIEPGAEFREVVSDCGLGGRVVLISSPQRFSFVYGPISPRVAVSSGLIGGISASELRAVLEHERYHVAHLDPLKIVLARALSAAFFFLPVLDALYERYAAGRELAADRRALSVCGQGPLAAVLLKVIAGPSWRELEVSAPLGDRRLLDARVRQIESGREPKISTPHAMSLVCSLLAAASLIIMFLAAAPGHAGASSTLAYATLLDSLYCAIPPVLTGLLAYWLIALRAQSARG
jgi:beta-lactamase regulating signal transducer with metallopeptidase domain